MIAQDEEEFEKAHRLVQVTNDLNVNNINFLIFCKLQLLKSLCLQAGKLGSLNASELANTSWKSANSFIVDKDASYLRLSLGEFFGQRSEALGCLGGGSNVKRVSI